MLYIHQFPDWTRFRFDSPKVLNALGQTRLEEGKLIGIMQICGLKDIEAKLLAETALCFFYGHACTILSINKSIKGK